MIFSLDVQPARKGDCLLLHYGSRAAPGLMIIDGGPKGVYGPHLKPRLHAIRQARGLTGAESLPVDLMMVSHVDDDHIQGLLDLTSELIAAADASRPLPVRIVALWHNGLEALLGEAEAGDLTAQFGAAATGGGPAEEAIRAAVGRRALDEEALLASLMVLASIGQGVRLGTDARRLAIEPNPHADGAVIMAERGAEPVPVADGLSFTVAGPLAREVKALRKKHAKWAADQKRKRAPAAAALAAYLDRSVPNLASLVVLAEAAGRRMLLTGDARGDKILNGLETAGALAPGGTLALDLLKVPHHGSARNLEIDFFERLPAAHYVFSGNGEHGNPEREALAMLRTARGEAADYVVHLTYPVATIDDNRRLDRDTAIARAEARGKRPPAAWSDATDGLAAFLAAHPAFAAKVRPLAGGSRVIDLADPLAGAWPGLAGA